MMGAEQWLARLPSAVGAVQAVADDLCAGRSVIWLLPAGLESEAIAALLRAELWRRDADADALWLPDLGRDRPLAPALADAFQLAWPTPETPRTVDILLAMRPQLPDVIILDGLAELDGARRADWLDFCARWAEAGKRHAQPGQAGTALCVLAPAAAALDCLPEPAAFVSVRWWWAIPSALEILMICRQENGCAGDDSEARWREMVWPALAGNDLRLVECLWDRPVPDVPALMTSLAAYAVERGWTCEEATVACELAAPGTLGGSATAGMAPPEAVRSAWARGLISWTPEYGLELHSAAAALLGQTGEIAHRLWRGQVALLLPAVDRLRRRICQELTDRHGHDWPTRWFPPEDERDAAAVRADPIACELGHLAALLRECAELRVPASWGPVAMHLKWLRNELAHYRPIGYFDAVSLWRQLDMDDAAPRVSISSG